MIFQFKNNFAAEKKNTFFAVWKSCLRAKGKRRINNAFVLVEVRGLQSMCCRWRSRKNARLL